VLSKCRRTMPWACGLLVTLSGLTTADHLRKHRQLAAGTRISQPFADGDSVGASASRSRLVRQMLTESVLLALVGGAAGLYVAYAGTHAILLLAFRGAYYIPIDARPSVPALSFALLLSLATGVVFGIAPAWIASQSDPARRP